MNILAFTFAGGDKYAYNFLKKYLGNSDSLKPFDIKEEDLE